MKNFKRELSKVKRTERGWAGHFICADDCLFRRNTLLEYDGRYIVVSTIGRWLPEYLRHTAEAKFTTVGVDRYFETMAFIADAEDKYHDAICRSRVMFDSPWAIDSPDKELEADEMHNKVCDEIAERLLTDNIIVDEY